MTDRIIFEVPGRPQGKGRPRFGGGHAYTPATTRAYERKIAEAAQAAVAKAGASWDVMAQVAVFVMAAFPVPKSYTKAKREAALRDEIRPGAKPDLDNVVKAALDACNGIAFVDDSQVVSITAGKRFASERIAERCPEGCLTVMITRFGGEDAEE